MTPDVVVDIGNSRMKWGRCAGKRVMETAFFAHDDAIAWKRVWQLWRLNPLTTWALAGVVPKAVCRFHDWLALRDVEPTLISSAMFAQGGRMKLTTTVDEPDLIGVDRLVTGLAAYTFANWDVSVVAINVGTAMTVDFIKPDGRHVGGAILPGPMTMARSLQEATAKLPLVRIDPKPPSRGWGTNTDDAIELGIARAILGAADQLVSEWACRAGDKPAVFATGGNSGYFDDFKFTASVSEFTINPSLTLEGIRIAAEALP